MKKILYFITGAVPTERDLDKADELSTKDTRVLFRNASFVTDSDSIEQNDGLAGAVPERYAQVKDAVIIDGEDEVDSEGNVKPKKLFGPKA